MDDIIPQDIAHCSACGCRMDVSAMEPYTNVVCPDCGHHTRVKCELGQYLLVGRHAAGGMSMVFKARDVTLDREVAIKILNDTYSSDEQRMKQFEREAMITAAISHPHVVRVFTVGKAYGHFYIAMEMVAGENLEQRIARDGAIGEDEMLPIAAEIISGLQAAKQADLIHRDMKPGNILFDAMGHVKIVDFGLALVTQGGIAKADEIWATPYYVPPEALDGVEEDFRSDMYALGATLYHALSGQPPISDESKSTRAVRKAKETIASLGQVAPWLRPETCYLVDTAMALRPSDRFQSYAEMEQVWGQAWQAVKGEGAAEPIHSRERAKRRVKKSRGILGLIVACVIALVLIAVAVGMFLHNKNQPDEVVSEDVVVPDQVEDKDADTQGYAPEVAAKIARNFRNSHRLLGQKRYEEAKGVFISLMNDPQVKEPTASWAGVESVIATWLGGNTGDANQAIKALHDHIQRRNLTPDSKVGRVVQQLIQLGVVERGDMGDENMQVVYLMAIALKNWEIGAWEAAVPLFREVVEQDMPAESPLIVYHKIARWYLADYELLNPMGKRESPDNVEAARAQLAELKAALGSLRTKGRARFHVRVWQLRLHRQLKQLREDAAQKGDPVAKAPLYQDKLPEFRRLVAAAKFAEASELLQDVSLEEHEKDERDAWVYLSDSASAFLGELEQAIPEAGVIINLDGTKGERYSRIVASRSGGLILQRGSGQKLVTWAELKPESVLAIHQKVFRQTLSTFEGQKRTEQAVCYAWLTGMKDKARLAARRLAEMNANFRKRWTHTMRSHHETP